MIAVDPIATAATATFLVRDEAPPIVITEAEAWDEEIRKTKWEVAATATAWAVTPRRTNWD